MVLPSERVSICVILIDFVYLACLRALGEVPVPSQLGQKNVFSKFWIFAHLAGERCCTEYFDLHFSYLKKILTLAYILRGMFYTCIYCLWPHFVCVLVCLLDSWELFRVSEKLDFGDPKGTKRTPSFHFHFDSADGILEEDMEQSGFFKESNVFIFSFMASGWILYVIKKTFPTLRL